MPKYLTEFVGTFFLVLIIGLATQGPLSASQGASLAALAIGLGLTALVYMGGPISAAHYNPAVTLGFLLRGRIAGRDVVPYVVAQLVGALAASAVVYFIVGKKLIVAPGSGYSLGQVIAVEALFTFMLMLVILNVATAKRSEGNSYYGVAIGFTIAGAAFAGGGISGGAFNPAVGLAPAVMDALTGGESIKQVWIYIVGPCLGAVLATGVFRLQSPEDHVD